MKLANRLNILFVLLTMAVGTAWAQDNALNALDAPKLNDRTVQTERHRITVGQSGLPDQLVIVPQQHELPLERRGQDNLPDGLLNSMGRGPQLRAPMQLVATIQGQQTPAEVASAATPKLEGGEVTAQSQLKAGDLTAKLSARYTRDGAMMLSISYSGDGQVEELALVAQLAGPVDVAIPGAPVGDQAKAYGRTEFALAGGDGVVWGNSKEDADQAGRAAPGVLKHLYVGNGDRGFTLLTNGGDGWAINPAQSMAVVERDEQGNYTLRIRIINSATRLGGEKTVQLALLTHPATPRAENFRDQQWTAPMGGEAATPALNLETRTKAPAIQALRGDANAFEALAKETRVTGPAGVALPKDVKTVIDAYPLSLFRYLTGTQTGLLRRIAPDNQDEHKPGGNPKPDRSMLGRALLHDAGLNLAGLANVSQAMQSMNKLVEFGLFEEQKVEFIPYWRTDGMVRFGPRYETDDPFALSTENPFADVKISIYRHDAGNGKTEAIMIIANETDQPVRQLLYILDSERVFGGVNKMHMREVLSQIDFEGIPNNADWRAERVNGLIGKQGMALQDLEQGGAVQQASVRDDSGTIFGNVFIPAHDFRILYGYSTK